MLSEYRCKNDENYLGHIIYYPEQHDNLPLVIYLHGAGETGEELEKVNAWGLPQMIKRGFEYPAICLCPQCPLGFVWDNIVADVKKLIDEVVKRFNIASDKIYLTGGSMGGFGTFCMAATYPGFFRAIAPVAGGGMVWRSLEYKNTPVLCVHGDKDDCVPIIYSKLMVDGINAIGGNARLITMEGKAHEVIGCGYTDTELLDWLLKQ